MYIETACVCICANAAEEEEKGKKQKEGEISEVRGTYSLEWRLRGRRI